MIEIEYNHNRYGCNTCNKSYETTDNDIAEVMLGFACVAMCKKCRMELYKKLDSDLFITEEE